MMTEERQKHITEEADENGAGAIQHGQHKAMKNAEQPSSG